MPIRNPSPFLAVQPLTAGNYHFAGHATVTTSTSLTNGWLRLSPWLCPGGAISAIGGDISIVGSVNGVLRMGIYADNGSGYPGALLLDAGTIDGTSATVQEQLASVVLPRGLIWTGGALQGGPSPTQPTVRCWMTPTSFPVGLAGTSTPAANTVVVGYAQGGVTGALPSSFTTTVTTTWFAPRLHVKAA